MSLAMARKNATPVTAAATTENSDNADMPVLFDLPKFKLLDQDGHDFTDAQLRGKPFVASFVFTHCAGPCPMMFGKMAAMQKSVPNPNIKLVTFTVDPQHDTPEVLKKKAKDLGADESRWYFLTGDKDSVHALFKGMLMPTPGPDDDALMHTTQFYLFDAAGQCRGRYFSTVDEQMEALTKDAETLAARKSS
jgi:cytochrome oxidase Cu insertion factor (SCO1/SenC/PrrC family)